MTTLAATSAARSRGIGISLMRFCIAVVAAQSLPGSLLLLGYLQRRMRWQAATRFGDDVPAPTWLQSADQRIVGWRRLVGGLTANLREGLGATVALAVLALPPGVCMAISCHAGWNNSFNKGYEHAAFGPLLGITGIALGMLLATYLPIAHARFAATGDWRALYACRSNLVLIRAVAVPALSLPLLAGCFAGVLLIARAGPMFAPQIPALAGSIEDPSTFLNRWFLITGVPLIALLYWFRSRSVALYVLGLRRTALTGLRFPQEQAWLARDPVASAAPGNILTTLALLLQCGVWFGLFALLYVQQFLNNIGPRGWLDHPLLWLPWLGYSV